MMQLINALMKDNDYGLTASVNSADKARALIILKQLDTSSGYWYCCHRVSAALPWSNANILDLALRCLMQG